MQPVRLALVFLALQVVTPQAGPLRVLRVTPTSPADPNDVVTVTFDRPVAGGLDATVDPQSIFSIEPAVAGRVEWRDPVTLRFTPSKPLEPGASYTITLTPNFTAMDGSRLDRPYTHTFRVSPPRVLGGHPVSRVDYAQWVTPEPTFSVVLSSPVDPAQLARYSFVRLSPECGAGDVVRLRPAGTRRITRDDPFALRYAGFRGGYEPGSPEDPRVVVELVPATPLPLGCYAHLVTPREVDGTSASHNEWPFSTHGPLALSEVKCHGGKWCPTGPIIVRFSNPVRGADVLRHVRIAPNEPFTIADTAAVQAVWTLHADLRPREHYAVVVDTALTDIFGQRMENLGVRAIVTTGYPPRVGYEFGRLLVERNGLRTLAVQHVNVDSLEVTVIPVPDTMEAAFLGQSWRWWGPWQALEEQAVRWSIPVAGGDDVRRFTGVPVPGPEALRSSASPAAPQVDRAAVGETARAARRPTLYAVRVSSAQLDSVVQGHQPIAVVQVTDLAVHVRLGADQAVVWVTGVSDGLPRPGARVTLYDPNGRVRATGTTGADGTARLDGLSPVDDGCGRWGCGFEGYVAAELGDDRAVVGVSSYDPDLSPWRFNVRGAWGNERDAGAAAVFTERGIYRPGETVYAKAIVRDGPLGSLHAPAPGDSIRWIFRDREGGELHREVAPLGAFGTSDRAITLDRDLPLGHYWLEIQRRRGGVGAGKASGAGSGAGNEGEWKTVATASYQVAEYRPPEFLVDVVADATPRFSGDSTDLHVAARYLFGAPMAGAPVRWVVRSRAMRPWEFEIPGLEEYAVGAGYAWWEGETDGGVRVTAQGVDTLGADGTVDMRLPLPVPDDGRPARVDLLATVTDANRQTVSSGATLTVHPADFYIAARTRGQRYFWMAGEPVTLEVLTARPDGERVEGVDVRGVVVRREWHVVRRLRGGVVDEVGGWVQDTVATCDVRTRREPATCTFTPPAGGSYYVDLTATDSKGRTALTRLHRWAAGSDWVPWNDDTKFKMDVIADRERYSVGDTATIFFASPITDAEAWITVERERVIEQHRIRLTSGATTLKFPITEAYVPNAFVSIVVVRGRSAEPGPIDDPGRPTLRVGYTELRVTPEVKRLAVEVRPERPEYRPGDTARVHLRVRDAAGRGQRAEVTLWAVDEGVLALTGYRTPDPIDLLYPPRGVGMRLASNLVAVAAQIPEGEKGRREAGGGGGDDAVGVLRSRFQSTAFFLGSVVTDANGNATAAAKLPDNLTTFRVMAVAVTAGDRYGSGQSELLVSRPLLARPALPRFLREGDRFHAGAVINSRMPGEQRATVTARVEGIRLDGDSRRRVGVAPGRGVEARFDFRAVAANGARSPFLGAEGDSARFRFDVEAGGAADAVAVAVPIRPNHYPLAQTIAGVLRDTATVVFTLDPDVDPARSTLRIDLGSSPLAFLRGARRQLRVYPYYCTEQIVSAGLPLIALYKADLAAGEEDPEARREIEELVRTIARRQRPDGGIGYWGNADWTSPWLSAYAGRFLLEAREAGVAVDQGVLDRLADYLARSLRQQQLEPRFVVSHWQSNFTVLLAERIGAVDYLSRLGRPDVAAENTLVGQAARLSWEDRVLLAEILARRGRSTEARSLLDHALASVRVDGRTAVLPDSFGTHFYFRSTTRPTARLLTALLAIDPEHELVGSLVETLIDQGRIAARRRWNTQDYGSATLALLEYERVRREAGPAPARVRSGRRTLVDASDATMAPDTTIRLDRLQVDRGPDGRPVVRLSLEGGRDGAPVYYFLTVTEAARGPQLEPVDRGIQVERWYEDVRTGQPIVSVAEGELVRVRLRVTVPAERHFVVLDDPLPAGLEPVDLSLRTLSPFGGEEALTGETLEQRGSRWAYGSWDSGMWSPFDHKEMRDDRVVYSATVLWPGTYTATYLARATTAGTFLYPPAHAEEMYNPGVNGRSGGGEFTVVRRD